jgi:hypothetical protein
MRDGVTTSVELMETVNSSDMVFDFPCPEATRLPLSVQIRYVISTKP